MFNTKNLVHDVKQVPQAWIFEYFCKLKQKLNGHDVKIKSVFNSDERTPSMCIYAKNNDYLFKDFSSGKGGDGITFVKELYQIKYHQACHKIIEEYNDYVLQNKASYSVEGFKQQSKYKVTDYGKRMWSTQDQYFWTQFNIGTKLLSEYNVVPLSYYKMTKDDNELTIKGLYLYGYFKKDGTLYKIYQPKTLDKKFIKVETYIQGIEQVTPHEYLVITSSLKDVMSIKSLKINVDVIAPDSENTMIKKEMIENFIKSYKKVVLLFDNDNAGITSMEKYKTLYPALSISVLPMSKDVSDSIKDFGPKEVKTRLVPILNKKLNEKKENT